MGKVQEKPGPSKRGHKAKNKGKGKSKAKRGSELERLKPQRGWEDWAKGKKLRRQLEYDEESDY